MRDVALTLIMLVIVPNIFFRPALGPLAWAWVSMMVPHRLTFGFAYSLPFAQLVGGVTLIALFAAKERHKVPWITPIRYLAYFYAVMCFTTIIALNNVGDAFDIEAISKAAGRSTHEIRTWVAAFAALAANGPYDARQDYYRPINEWIAGYGVVSASLQ